MSSSHHHASSSGSSSMEVHNPSRSRSRSRSVSRGRLRQGSSGSGGQSCLSAHIQQQMERPRRERDPTPTSGAHAESMRDLNYYNGSPPPLALPSPPTRNSANAAPRRTTSNINPTNGGGGDGSNSSSPSSCEERAAIAANLAKSSFSAHRNLQKLIDEQRERECRMEHAQQQQQQKACRRESYSSVAAVNQQPPQHSPLKLMVGNEGFYKQGTHGSAMSSLSTSPSTLLTMTPSSDVGGNGIVASTPGGGNSGYHNPRQQQYQQQQQQRRCSTSPRKQRRDQSMNITRLPGLDEEQQQQQQQQHRDSINTIDSIVTDRPDSELAKSIAKIVSFHKRNSTPCASSSNVQQQQQQFNRSFSANVSYDTNAAQQQQQQQRRNKTLSKILDRSDFDFNGKSCSFHSNSTTPTTASSLDSESLFNSPTNSSLSKSPKSQPQQRQIPSTPRYIDKETLHNHLMHAPRESRVQLTRLIENLQNENQRLNAVNLAQVNQIDKLESEVADLLRELLRYRRECGELDSVDYVGAAGESEGDVSSEHATAPPPPPPASTSPSRQMRSPSKVEMDRQDATNLLCPYVKSKAFHEEAQDRRRPGTTRRRPSSMTLRNSITSDPDVKHTSSGSSNVSFNHNISMLKHLQLTQSSSPSDGDEGGDNENLRRSSSSSTTSFHSCSPGDICSNASQKTTDASMHTADESLFDSSPIAKQKSFKEEKKADTHATSRWRMGRFSEIKDVDDDPQSDGESSIHEDQIMLIQQQQQEQECNHQDEASRQQLLRKNSLEDIFAPQKRRSCFVEQKGGSTAGSESFDLQRKCRELNESVPSMADTVDAWSCSTPGSGGR
jgi:hypothetical protein